MLFRHSDVYSSISKTDLFITIRCFELFGGGRFELR